LLAFASKEETKNMANINLSTGGEIERQESGGIFSGGIIWAFVALIATLALYAGISAYSKIVSGNIESTKGEYKKEYDRVLGGSGRDIVDFQNRLDEAKSSLSDSKNMRNNLQLVEKAMVPGSFLVSYKYDSKLGIVSLLGLADNYNVVAKQILGLKGIPDFSSVDPKGNSYDSEKNKVLFNIDIKLKNY
jgi:hypothetical protein